ncbi:MAG: hypothetical protein J2P24_03885 [Streptosporangiales bacterium]|nr:hypothetical protein [Streptosporangiales bacterium]MBO0890820.1 hypothetical protein [Acidothermales bacterium]
MSISGDWPFTDITTVGRRGDLLVLAGVAPDGAPVTITRLAPGPSTDAALHDRFRAAVEQVRRNPRPGHPPVMWADTRTLVPWAATYADPAHTGADLIAAAFDPAAPPPPVAPPPPAPAAGTTEAVRSSRTSLLIGISAGVVSLLLVLGIVVGMTVRSESSASNSPTATSSFSAPPTQPTAATTTDGLSTGSPQPKPTLKNVKPKSVYGPTWTSSDPVYPMAFATLPWAFRTPSDFDCLITGTSTDVTQLSCLKLFADPGEQRRATIVDRTCPGTKCTTAERERFQMYPSGDKVAWRRKDATTWYYVRTFTNQQSGGKYFGFYLSHLYRDGSGRLRKHLSVYAEAPVGRYAVQIQKTVNDIRTQSGS